MEDFEKLAVERIQKLIMDWIPRERRKSGRPRKTWMEGVQAAVTKRNLEPDQWRNREEWSLVSRRQWQLLKNWIHRWTFYDHALEHFSIYTSRSVKSLSRYLVIKVWNTRFPILGQSAVKRVSYRYLYRPPNINGLGSKTTSTHCAGRMSRPLETPCNEEIQENILILCNGFPYM